MSSNSAESSVSKFGWSMLCATLLALLLCLPAAASGTQDVDLHQSWDNLLHEHVHWDASGNASSVDYAGMQRERQQLDAYLGQLSAVPLAQYQSWDKAQRWTFLINAYNAFTVDLILSRYPDLKSIKDLGSWLRSPWKQSFFSLLGEQRTLDQIEHQLLRGGDDYDDPRIHFAVNCASIGCPALRPEAFQAETLDQQLEDQTTRFLSDRSRNRLEKGTLRVSRIFDWYGQDFAMDFRGAGDLSSFLALYSDALGLSPEQAADLRRAGLKIEFLPYDWALNDVAR